MFYYNLFCYQESPEEQQTPETVIPPGGDPDAGMPADQAEIHGIERHSVPQTLPPTNANDQGSPHNLEPNEESHPSESNNPDDQPPLCNEHGHHPVRTSPAEQGSPPILDTVDTIDEDVAPLDTLIDNDKNETSVPDSA